MAFCCWLALGRAEAQPGADLFTVQSSSRQFLAVAPRTPGASMAAPPSSAFPGRLLRNSDLRPNSDGKLPLDPSLLVITCERIKQALLLTLGRRDQWRGGITLLINPALPENQGPVLEGVHDPNGWNYRLTLPSPIESRLLFRAIVKALLTEMANRHAGAHSAEVPLWLVAGLSAHLQADNLPTFLLRPQSQPRHQRNQPAGAGAVRDQLRRQPPLTFQELCWPEPERLAGQNYEPMPPARSFSWRNCCASRRAIVA